MVWRNQVKSRPRRPSMRSTSNPTSIAQKAAVEALCGPQDAVKTMLDEFRRRRDHIVAGLNGIAGELGRGGVR